MTSIAKKNGKHESSKVANKTSSRYDNCVEDVRACPGLMTIIEELEPFLNVDKLKLLCGKTGVGKEYLARYIHAKSMRSTGPFIGINMAIFTSELLISELCGFEKGAFSGANIKKIGLFQYAENGTIFLDEFNSISPINQGKILRIIEEREILPIGGLESIKINCRIIVGVNENLSDMVKAKTLREDLYHRINALEFIIPPLKDRRQDIPILVKRIVSQIAEKKGVDTPVISNEAMMLLIVQDWTGNVRELHNVLYYIIYKSLDKLITADQIKEALNRKNLPVLAYKKALAMYEKGIIEAVLLSSTSKSKAAELLGIGKSTLRDKLRRLEINSD